MFKKLRLIVLAFIILITGCMPVGTFQIASVLPVGGPKKSLTVFAAASLTEAFNELATRYKAENPDVDVILNFAGSQQLSQQIIEGAPADVFASANQRQMEIATLSGRIDRKNVSIFANNHLIVVFPADNPARLGSLSDLAKPGLKIGLAAQAVPVGQYSLEFLENASAEANFGPQYKDEVLANVVTYEQTVKAVLSKVILGEVDAGIVYVSDAWGPDAGKLGRLVIPDTLNPLASYTIAALNDSSDSDLANSFVAFVLSPPGQEILAKNGLMPFLTYR
jgi:molybdate transport system substrate-binding protein